MIVYCVEINLSTWGEKLSVVVSSPLLGIPAIYYYYFIEEEKFAFKRWWLRYIPVSLRMCFYPLNKLSFYSVTFALPWNRNALFQGREPTLLVLLWRHVTYELVSKFQLPTLASRPAWIFIFYQMIHTNILFCLKFLRSPGTCLYTGCEQRSMLSRNVK